MKTQSALLALSVLVGASLAKTVPQNVQNLYNSIKNQKKCNNVLQGGFYALGDGKNGKHRFIYLVY
jgi:hypothetical protein